jgi:hypothetical protein
MEPESNNNNKALHTLADDMALALTKNEGGIVKKIIEEEEKKEEEKKKRELYKMRNRVYIVLAILFLIAAGVTVSIVFFKENPISFFIQKRFTPIIFHEGTEIIDISNNDKEEISDKINEIILKSNLGKGEILGIYLRDNNKTITFDNFLQKLESPFIYPTGTFEPNFLLGAIKREVKTNIEENKEEQNQDKTPKKILENFVTFSSKDFFVNQKVDFLSEDAKNKMIELIGYFLEIVNLNDDKIQVLGIYPTENKNANSEKEASLYKDFGISFLTEILKSKYKEEELKNLTLESGIKGIGLSDLYLESELALMNESDKATLISLNSGLQLLRIPKALIDLKEDTASEPVKVDITKPISSIYKEGTDIFILLNIPEGKDVFTAMKTWENKMFSDLHEVFGIPLSLDTGYLLTKNFEDSIIQNKNARILRDGSGKVVLMYVYIDNNTLVITNTEEGAKEIIFRVNSSKVKK